MSDLQISLERARSTFPPPDLPLERVLLRRERRLRDRRIRAGSVAGMIAAVGIALFIRTIALEPDVIPAGPVGNGAIVVLDGERLIMIGPDGTPRQLIGGPIVAEGCPAEASCKAAGPYAWSADGTLLAFVADSSSSSGRQPVYAVGADGGDPHLIGMCDRRCPDMAWSPEGHRLAFASSNTITLFDMETNERTQIRLAPCADYCVISPPSPLDLAWSPDGTQIASVSDYHTITVSAADGSAASMLVEPGRGDPKPVVLAWSSDTSIAYSIRRGRWEESEGIWSLDVDTTATAKLVDVGRRPSIGGLLVAPDGSLVWKQANGPCPNPGCPFTGTIWTADSGGSDPHVLYDSGCCTASSTNDVFTGPVLSPDGTQLVFAVIYGEDRAAESGVYVMNLDGTGVQQIATVGTNPAWQPVPKGSA